MKIKKIFAALAAAAVSAVSFASMTFSTASAASQLGQATLMGNFGTESSWDYTGAKTSVVAIDGDAQYECNWTITTATTPGASCFLAVVIEPVEGVDNFATATFPDLTATLDEVWVDGIELTDFDASSAVDANYFENGPGVTRIYLRGDWANNPTKAIADDQGITSEIMVRFTIAGTGQQGTSNVGEDPTVPADPTDAPTDAPDDGNDPTDAPTDAPEDGEDPTDAPQADAEGTTTTTADDDKKDDDKKDNSKSTTTAKKDTSNKKTTTKAASNGGSDEKSADTGDAGTGIAIAALALAGTAAVVSRKRK